MKKTIATALVGVVSLVGVGTTDIGQKVIKCTGKQVQIEYGDNWYCGSKEEHTANKAAVKTRLQENKTYGDEFGYVQLIARNDEVFAKEAQDILLAKYDSTNHQFIGSAFDLDVQNQLALFVDLADIKCAGSCELVGETLNEKAYNLLTK